MEQSVIVLGSNARCKFDSATRLVIDVFSDSRLEPRESNSGIDVLTLADGSSTGLVRSDTNSGMARETFSVSLPEEPVRPVARISAPSQGAYVLCGSRGVVSLFLSWYTNNLVHRKL